MKQEAKIPKLRFAGFVDEWVTKRLDEIGTVIRGSSPRPQGDRRYYGGTIPRLMVADVTRDGKYVTPQVDFLTEAGARLSRPCKAGTLTIVCSGTVGIPSILAVDACIHDGFLALIDIDETISQDYVYHQLTTLRDIFERSATHGGVFTNLTTSGIKEIEIAIPSYSEQQKIAVFLSAVDARIGQLAKKKDILREYKRAVMQQIFTQKIRFKDDNGNNFPNWEEKKFADVFSFLPTNSFSRDALNYDGGAVKNIHYGDIHTSFRPLFEINNEKVPYINKEVPLTGISDESYCKKGDLVFADASEDYSDVGKCIEIIDLNGELVLAGLHTLLARPGDNTFASGFAGFLMKAWETRWQIMREAQGTKVLGISAGRLSKIRLSLPSIQEQKKIASFLAALSEKTEVIEKQEKSMRGFKKGLLQQMFV